MTEAVIRPLLTADPFEPFTLHMTSRNSYDIDRPEAVSFSPHGGALYVRHPDGRQSVLSLPHIVSISFPDRPVEIRSELVYHLGRPVDRRHTSPKRRDPPSPPFFTDSSKMHGESPC